MEKTMILNTGIKADNKMKVTCHNQGMYTLIILRQMMITMLRGLYRSQDEIKDGLMLTMTALLFVAMLLPGVKFLDKGIDVARQAYIEYQVSRRFDIVEVEIKEGDTFWELQRALTPGEADLDMSTLVYELNQTDLSQLQPGDTLTLLAPKN